MNNKIIFAEFQEQLMNRTSENGKNPSFGLDFGPLDPNLPFLLLLYAVLLTILPFS